MTTRSYCCEICDRVRTCGVDCGSCAMTDADHGELHKFAEYLRLSVDAEHAGCTTSEAARAMYPHVYADDPEAPEMKEAP